MNIKQIVEERLRKDRYDGLCCTDCACKVGNLMACGEPSMECVPGYIRYGRFHLDGIVTDWIIVPPPPAHAPDCASNVDCKCVRLWLVIEEDRGMGSNACDAYATEAEAKAACGGHMHVEWIEVPLSRIQQALSAHATDCTVDVMKAKRELCEARGALVRIGVEVAAVLHNDTAQSG